MERNNEYDWILKLLKDYKLNEIQIHVNLKTKAWLNGNIISIGENSFMLNEEVFGEMEIHYKLVRTINKRERRR